MIDNYDLLNGKVVAVTGANGYIGSTLVDGLSKSSCSIIQISRNEFLDLGRGRSILADIRNPEAWYEIVSEADVIFHLAGNTSVYEGEKDPLACLNSIILPINHLIKAAKELKRRPRVIYASTATVYGITPLFPVSEKFKPKPITRYDQYKLFAENQLELAAQDNLIECISLRLSNVFGPSIFRSSSHDRGILNRVALMALQNKDITIYGDGQYLRDYIFIGDVVDAMIIAGTHRNTANGVFNISTGTSFSIGDAFNMVATRASKITGNQVKSRYLPWFEGAHRIESRSYISDPGRAFRYLGWRSKVSLEEGIDNLLRHYLAA